MPKEHAADRAAGEVVYSSEGLPTVVAPTPKAINRSADERGDMNVLDAGGKNNAPATAEQAFEVFSGKVYPISVGRAGGAVRTGGPNSESTAQRLSRLQREVDELEQDLMSDLDYPKAAAGEGGDKVHGLLDLVSSLKTQINMQAGVAAASKDLAEMNLSIQQHLREWKEQKSNVEAGGDIDSKAELADSGVVYELYGRGVVSLAATTSSTSTYPTTCPQPWGVFWSASIPLV